MGIFSLFGSNGASQKEAEKEQRKKEKEREWKDPNEQIKYVCQGGKAQCKYCNPPIADIIVTSTTVMLQDKPWATVGDKDGKVNFNFTGVCTHPSQQKLFSPPPPCKSVINLGAWKDYSKTMIDNYNALLVKSKIPCMISGENLEITHSGQVAELTRLDLIPKKIPEIIRMFWMDEEEKVQIKRLEKGKTGVLYIYTKNYEADTSIRIDFKDDDEKTESLTGIINEEGLVKIKRTFQK